jgi:hypothetical protein
LDRLRRGGDRSGRRSHVEAFSEADGPGAVLECLADER